MLGRSFAQNNSGKKLEKSFVSQKDISFSDDGSQGNIVACDSFDSDTQIVVESDVPKSSGLGYKEFFKLQMPKIAPITEGGAFKEGEEDDYNSEYGDEDGQSDVASED